MHMIFVCKLFKFKVQAKSLKCQFYEKSVKMWKKYFNNFPKLGMPNPCEYQKSTKK